MMNNNNSFIVKGARMTVAIEGYKTSIISEDGHPEKFGHILVEHQGKLTDDIFEAIKDDCRVLC